MFAGKAFRKLRATLELVAELRRSRRLPEILRSVDAPGDLADAVQPGDNEQIAQPLDLYPRFFLTVVPLVAVAVAVAIAKLPWLVPLLVIGLFAISFIAPKVLQPMFGDIGIFSFAEGKNMPCFGGGAMVTSDDDIAAVLASDPDSSVNDLYESFAIEDIRAAVCSRQCSGCK